MLSAVNLKLTSIYSAVDANSLLVRFVSSHINHMKLICNVQELKLWIENVNQAEAEYNYGSLLYLPAI